MEYKGGRIGNSTINTECIGKNKRNKHLPNRFMAIASPYLSYVLGVLMGDGSLYKTRQRYLNRKDKYVHVIHLSVRDKQFAIEFAHALSKIFDKAVKIIKCNEKQDRGIFYKVFVASKDFYKWFNSTKTFEWGIKYPNEFIKGFFDSDGSFGYNTSGPYRYPIVRMIGSDKMFLKKLKKMLYTNYSINAILKSRGIPKPTFLNNRLAIWRKEVYELGIFNNRDVNVFLNIVDGSNKLINKGG